MRNILIFIAILAFIAAGCREKNSARDIVVAHAKAWEDGDIELLDSILHEDVVFAYPGRRLDKNGTLKDMEEYNEIFNQTKIYISKIIVDGDDVAVEWQFASTNKKTGNRTAVSDAIIGKIKDGKIIVWKEYLDGRVSRLQIAGNLSLEEGKEPFPWPKN